MIPTLHRFPTTPSVSPSLRPRNPLPEGLKCNPGPGNTDYPGRPQYFAAPTKPRVDFGARAVASVPRALDRDPSQAEFEGASIYEIERDPNSPRGAEWGWIMFVGTRAHGELRAEVTFGGCMSGPDVILSTSDGRKTRASARQLEPLARALEEQGHPEQARAIRVALRAAQARERRES